MPPDQELGALQGFIAGRPPLGVAVVASTPATDPRPGEPQTLSLAGDARDYFYDVIDRAIGVPIQRNLWRLRPLDPVYKPDALDLEFAALGDVPAVALACNSYGNLGPYGEFTGNDDFVKRLAHYVAVLGAPGGDQAFFYRSFSSSAELRRKRGAALARRDGQFARVEDKIFVFDDAIDCFVYRDVLFVIRKGDYRRVFDQFEALRASAVAAATDLHNQVPIDNFDGFREACAGQAAMADKLVAVRQRDYFAGLTVDRLKPIIAEFSLDIDLTMRDGREHLVFKPDPRHRWLILKLLDDDYLRSSMTNRRYEANSKLPAGPG
jgi:hypothetical protein